MNQHFQPAAMAEIDAKAIFNIVLGSWDLKTCNNHLVAFIDRARVLAEAYEIKGSLPTTLYVKREFRTTLNLCFLGMKKPP